MVGPGTDDAHHDLEVHQYSETAMLVSQKIGWIWVDIENAGTESVNARDGPIKIRSRGALLVCSSAYPPREAEDYVSPVQA